MANLCTKCGRDIDIVGIAHYCVPSRRTDEALARELPKVEEAAKRSPRLKQQSGVGSERSSPAKKSRGGVEGHAKSKPSFKKPDLGRVPSAAGIEPGPRDTTTHQYRDPEKRRAYMADYMRKWRARQAEQRAKDKN